MSGIGDWAIAWAGKVEATKVKYKGNTMIAIPKHKMAWGNQFAARIEGLDIGVIILRGHLMQSISTAQ